MVISLDELMSFHDFYYLSLFTVATSDLKVTLSILGFLTVNPNETFKLAVVPARLNAGSPCTPVKSTEGVLNKAANTPTTIPMAIMISKRIHEIHRHQRGQQVQHPQQMLSQHDLR